MTCPRCRTELEKKSVRGRGVEVDRCPKCGGVWADAGEVGQILGAAPGPRPVVPQNARAAANDGCPRCRKPLYVFAYPGSMTVVDGCRECAGIWLDAGELEEIHRARRGKQMTCPACGQEQPRAETCSGCGVIVRKAIEPRQPRAAEQAARPTSPPMHAGIPGVKGKLIRFIDASLAAMLDGIKQP